MTCLLVGDDLLGAGIFLGLERRRAHLVRVPFGQSEVASIDQKMDVWVHLEQVVDAFSEHGCLVVHPPRPPSPTEQQASVFVTDGRDFDRVLLALAGDKPPPTREISLRATHLDVRPVEPAHLTGSIEVGKGISHGAECLVVLDLDATLGEQGPDLSYGSADRGPVHAEQGSQHVVCESVSDERQGDHQPVGKVEIVTPASAPRALVATPLLADGFALELPCRSQLDQQIGP